MKQLLLLLAVSFMATACTEKSYRLEVDFNNDDATAQKVYLINYDSSDTIDSALVVARKAIFQGKVKDNMVARVLASGARATFILEGGDIAINWAERKATGTELNDSLAKFNDEVAALGNEMEALNKQQLSDDELAAQVQAIEAKIADAMLAHYTANKKNAFGWWSLYQYMVNGEFSLQQLQDLLAQAPKEYAEQSVRMNKLLAAAQTVERTKEGCKMVDFTVKTEDGIATSLSDFVGKGEIVVVDFWASWCGPCRREASTTLKQIYDKYNGKGLSVLGVAVWDKPEDTFAAIEQLALPWPQIINSKNIASDAYGFNSIPHIIVFSGDGTILCRGLLGDELMAKIDEIMAK
ncbi:MAG: redoxin domain-containing protein [Muribaculaceae bacterium]